MAKTPAQPANPPQGTSPSPSINRAAKTSWDSWHKHGNKDAAGAIADDKGSIRKEIDPSKNK